MTPSDFFRQLADGAPVMIWMSGLDMGCFYFNHEWLDFRGRTLEEESGNGWAEGVHPDDLNRCVHHYVSCFERRVAFAMSYRLKNRDDVYKWILDRGVPHYDGDGQYLGMFGGCAEMDERSPLGRHSALGQTLAEMREFAAHLATGHVAVVNAEAQPEVKASLLDFARAQGEPALRPLWKHAAKQMRQLAVDMAAFGQIARGECLP